MSWVAAAVVGGAVVGGYIQGQSAMDAADTQASAARYATDEQRRQHAMDVEEQRRQYDQTRADQQPWRDTGVKYLGQLDSSMPDLNKSFTMEDFQADPGYQFRMQQGISALDRSAASRGGRHGGGAIKASLQFGQDLASQEYQNAYNRFENDKTNRFNRLSSLAGVGQVANQANQQAGTNMVNNLSNMGQNYANNVSNNIIGAGNAQAAGIIGQGNAVNGAIGNGINNWATMTMMNRMNQQPISTGNSTGQSYTNYGNYA